MIPHWGHLWEIVQLKLENPVSSKTTRLLLHKIVICEPVFGCNHQPDQEKYLRCFRLAKDIAELELDKERDGYGVQTSLNLL